jgi:hypothetical protein
MSPEELARKQADIERRERELQAQAEKIAAEKARSETAYAEYIKKQREAARKEAGIFDPSFKGQMEKHAYNYSRTGKGIATSLMGNLVYAPIRAAAGVVPAAGIAAAKFGVKAAAAIPAAAIAGAKAVGRGIKRAFTSEEPPSKPSMQMRLQANYDYSSLMQQLDQLTEQQYDQLIESLDDLELQTLETAIELSNMQPGYDRLRTRLYVQFDEVYNQHQVPVAIQKIRNRNKKSCM